jgi:hypothetical protein
MGLVLIVLIDVNTLYHVAVETIELKIVYHKIIVKSYLLFTASSLFIILQLDFYISIPDF